MHVSTAPIKPACFEKVAAVPCFKWRPLMVVLGTIDYTWHDPRYFVAPVRPNRQRGSALPCRGESGAKEKGCSLQNNVEFNTGKAAFCTIWFAIAVTDGDATIPSILERQPTQ
jgi:hypothetical protein